MAEVEGGARERELFADCWTFDLGMRGKGFGGFELHCLAVAVRRMKKRRE